MPTLRSGLQVDSTLNRPAGRETKKQTRKRHSQKASNSQPASKNKLKKGPSGGIHPEIVKALSQTPYSPLFGILWPIIVEQASFETRDRLRCVNTYFERLCRPYWRSDLAKRSYASHYGNIKKRNGLPFVLDLSFDAEWRCWGGNWFDFNGIETFRAFCAIGDVDPDQGCRWNPHGYLTPYFYKYRSARSHDAIHSHIWMSRTKDVVFETWLNPLDRSGYCGKIGLTGAADKAIAMYDFVHGNYAEKSDESADEPATWRKDLMWKREY